jgi:hypothetical protein
VSDQIDDLSEDSASRWSERGKAEKLDERKIVPTVPGDVVPLDTTSLAAPPSDLADLFADPPLAGNEKREEFDRFFSAITAAVKPVDAIAWLYTWDVVCLSWEIKRERAAKAGIIRSAQIDFVSGLLSSNDLVWMSSRNGLSKLLPRPNGKLDARQWVKNPDALPEITKLLNINGYGPSDILAAAYIFGADNIDAIDRRIASYEARRMAVMREVEGYNEKFARNSIQRPKTSSRQNSTICRRKNNDVGS